VVIFYEIWLATWNSSLWVILGYHFQSKGCTETYAYIRR